MVEYIEKAELIDKLCHETAEWYYSPTIKTISEFPTADVQPVEYTHQVKINLLNYLFNKEREAEEMIYSPERQERIGCLREIIRYVENISPVDMNNEDMTLDEILTKLSDSEIYKCPKCSGRGTITVEYNAYPSGLLDSGFVYEAGYKNVECDLCSGEGYTKIKYRPKMVQDGWEEDV